MTLMTESGKVSSFMLSQLEWSPEESVLAVAAGASGFILKHPYSMYKSNFLKLFAPLKDLILSG